MGAIRHSGQRAGAGVRTDLTAALLDQPGVSERIADLAPMRRLATPEEVASAILSLASPAAEAASARYGWPLHVIDGAGDQPEFERPEAFLGELGAILAAAPGEKPPATVAGR